MPKLVYLNAEHLELVHAGILAKSGGLFGTREPGVLVGLESSLRQSVFGKELHPTLFHKAAVYMRTIITRHPFLDGNKRTGMISAFTFLELNGYRMTTTDSEVFEYALLVATEKPENDAITAWLKSHAKKTRSPGQTPKKQNRKG